ARGLRPPPPARVSPRRWPEHAARERRAAGPGGAVRASPLGARMDRLRDGRVEGGPARRRGAPPRGEPALRGLARAGGAQRRRLPLAPLPGGGRRRLPGGAALPGRAALPLAPPRRPPPLPRQPGALPPRAELLPLPRPGPRLRRLGARRPPALARAGGRGGAGGAAAVDVAVRANAGDAAAAVKHQGRTAVRGGGGAGSASVAAPCGGGASVASLVRRLIGAPRAPPPPRCAIPAARTPSRARSAACGGCAGS